VSLVIDLVSGPLLVIPRTKTLAIWLSLFFNLAQWFTFGGVVWLIHSFSLLLFLDPQFLRVELKEMLNFVVKTSLFPQLEKGCDPKPLKRKRPLTLLACVCEYPFMCVAAVFAVFQVVFPLRYLLRGGDVAWTEESRLFSWQGIVRHKFVQDGVFLCVDGISTRKIDPAKYLSRTQLRKMQGVPWMIHSFATYLNQSVVHHFGLKNPAIYGLFNASLNGPPFTSLVDPKVDLLAAHSGGAFSVPTYITQRDVGSSAFSTFCLMAVVGGLLFSWLRWLSKNTTKRI